MGFAVGVGVSVGGGMVKGVGEGVGVGLVSTLARALTLAVEWEEPRLAQASAWGRAKVWRLVWVSAKVGVGLATV